VTEIDATVLASVEADLADSALWDVDSGDMVTEATVEDDFWTFVAFGPEGDHLFDPTEYSTMRSLVTDPA